MEIGSLKALLDLLKSPFCYLLEYFRDSRFVIIPTQDNIEAQILRSKYQSSEAKGAPDDPFADYKIPYQQRMEGTDTTSELLKFLKLNNRVLVHGARGVGKTREAAKVAQEFSNDGWTVLNLPLDAYPHPPCRLLCRLLNHPDNHIFDNGVFLFIYDLQKRVVWDHLKTSRIQSLWGWIYNKNYQIDLIRTINYYEKQCERGKFKVLAIASTKGEAQRGRGDDENELNELEHLFSELLKKKKLKPYYLHPPTEEATIKFLSKFVAYADIEADSQDFFAIARMNRGSYKNIKRNLRRFKKKPMRLTKTTFEPTEKGTWAEFYEWALSQFNEHSKYVFDAVNLLLAANIMLTRTIVTETAFVLANCTRWHQWSKRRKIYRILDELITASDILNSGQGQIVANVAKGEMRLEYSKHILTLFSVLNTSLNKQPKKMFDSLLHLGRFALEENHFSDASRVFSRAAEMEKDNSEAWAQLGKARAGADDIQGAFEAYDRALNLDDSKVGVWYEKGILLLSKGKRCLSKREDEASTCFTQALDCLKKALDLRQHDHSILIQLGKVHAYKKARIEACEDFAKAMLLQNDDQAIKEGYESVEIERSEIDAAKARLLNDVRDPTQEEDALRCFLVGNYLRVDKKAYEESLRYYERATDLLEKFPHAWYGKGLAYAQIPQSTHRAEQCFKRAIDQDGKLMWVYYDLGRTLQAAGHCDEAIKNYRKAVEIDAQYFDAFYALGLACHEMKDYDLAIVYYDRALSIRENTAYVFFDRGRAKAMLEQHEKAIEDFGEAFRNDPTCVRALYHQGLSHAANNNFPAALKNYEDALRLQNLLGKKDPKNMDNYCPKRGIYFNGAESLYLTGNIDDAIEWCKKALGAITQEQPQKVHQGMVRDELRKDLLIDRARVEYLLTKCYVSETKFKDACGHLKQAFIIGGEEYINRAKEDKELKNLRQDSCFHELVEALRDSAVSPAAASVAEESIRVIATPHHPSIPTHRHVQ